MEIILPFDGLKNNTQADKEKILQLVFLFISKLATDFVAEIQNNNLFFIKY